MFGNVLIPLDGSELSGKVVGFLEPILQSDGSSCIALHVASDGEGGVSTAHPASVDALKRLAPVRVVERRGDPADEIVAAAREEDASLIAMSTHGRTGLSRLIRGSVAERVLRGADVPVLLVSPFARPQPDGSPIDRILVPLDGSPTSAAVLADVARIATVYGSRVTLFHVANPGTHESIKGELREAAREELFREQAAQYVHQLEEAGARATIEVVFEFGVASRILDAVEHRWTDLLAITTRGRSGIGRWLFGSVAEELVRRCRAPLLVKRVPGSAEGVPA